MSAMMTVEDRIERIVRAAFEVVEMVVEAHLEWGEKTSLGMARRLLVERGLCAEDVGASLLLVQRCANIDSHLDDFLLWVGSRGEAVRILNRIRGEVDFPRLNHSTTPEMKAYA